MNKYKDIHAKWLAEALIDRGHILFKITDNARFPQYKVYVFVNTKELGKDMDMITTNKNRLVPA